MDVTETHSEVLDQCRQAVSAEAGHMGGAGDTFPDGGAPSTMFGKLGSSASMASSVNMVDSRMRAEFGAAERLLRNTEQAVGAVEATVRSTDDNATTNLSPANA